MTYTQEQLDEMSEIEKNVAVLEKSGDTSFDGYTIQLYENGGFRSFVKCYCSDPASIMPIAFEHGISLLSPDEGDARWYAYAHVGDSYNTNPLIAIVDCFLMMEIDEQHK